ncbi:MAG TPA: hypothetical protein VF341_07890 [Anaeromyxobacteraceae bacterium]
MPALEPSALLAMLRDPNRESQEIASATGVPREEAARASRLVLGIARATPEELLTLPPLLALAVLHAAAAAQRLDLLAAAAAHPGKEVSKEAKRAVYALRMKGVAVPEARPAAPAPPAAPEPPAPCYASALDGHGERALWIGRSVPGKGIEVGQVVLSDRRGLIDLHLGLLGRKEYRQFGKDLLERGRGMSVVEVGREQAKGLVAAARRLNDAAGKPPPAGADAWLARLGPAVEAPDPASRFPPLPEGEEREAVEGSARLHDLPLVRGWLADEEALRTLAQKLDEVAVSSLYLDERQRAEAGTRAIAAAVAAYFDGPTRALWASRLFAMADHLARAGDAVHARLAAAAARALRAGSAPERIPFARLLVEKAFPATPAPPAPQPAGSLIVPP